MDYQEVTGVASMVMKIFEYPECGESRFTVDFFRGKDVQADAWATAKCFTDVDFDWSKDPETVRDVLGRSSKGHFSLVAAGNFPMVKGAYQFVSKANSGAEVRIDRGMDREQLVMMAAPGNVNVEQRSALTMVPDDAMVTVSYRMMDMTSTGTARFSWEKAASCGDDQFSVQWFSNDDLFGEPAKVTCLAVPAELDNAGERINTLDFLATLPKEQRPQGRFSVRAEGPVNLAEGTYRFGAVADRGQRVFVDGEKVLERWSGSAAQEHWACGKELSGPHVVRFEYRRGLGAGAESAAEAKLLVRKNPVCSGQWQVEYFRGQGTGCQSCENFLDVACHDELDFEDRAAHAAQTKVDLAPGFCATAKTNMEFPKDRKSVV